MKQIKLQGEKSMVKKKVFIGIALGVFCLLLHIVIYYLNSETKNYYLYRNSKKTNEEFTSDVGTAGKNCRS